MPILNTIKQLAIGGVYDSTLVNYLKQNSHLLQNNMIKGAKLYNIQESFKLDNGRDFFKEIGLSPSQI